MTFKAATILMLAAAFASPVIADEAAPAAEAPKENAELEGEIGYVEALISHGYPDFAAPVVEATKKKWPESEARFFAIEIRGMLALGQFEEAEKKIAALPDRNSAKFWGARLEVANNYFFRGRKADSMKIYGEFFKVFAKPSAEIRQFYINACYAYGQLLAGDKQYAEAAKRYEQLLPQVTDEGWWCNLACETVDLYLRLATELAADPKKAKARNENLAKADAIVSKLLWKNETQPLYFGRAVSMKAHIEQLRGDLAKASGIIDDYREMLEAIHAQIVEHDPDGKEGLLRQSPLPECMYLQSKMLWDEAQAEYRKEKRDDEKVKVYMFGPKGKKGKRITSKGCFAMAQTVFLRYETSSWALAAGNLAEEVKKFTKERYGVDVKTKVTPEQLAKVRAAQFRDGAEKFAEGKFQEAIDSYSAVLAKYPEIHESIPAAENIASAYLDLIHETTDAAKKDEYRLNADAVEGYLAERFAESKDRVLMTEAGNAVLRLAAKEQERKNARGAERLYAELFLNYRSHAMSAVNCANCANQAQKAENYKSAIMFWDILATCYTNSAQYALSLSQLAACHEALGETKQQIDYLNRFLAAETVKIRRLQAEFKLAQIYLADGTNILASAATNEVPEAVEATEKAGSAQIVRAIKTFSGFTAEVDAALKDPSTTEEDAGKYRMLREAALFMVGECWSRMNRPEKNLAAYRERAAKSYEAYAAEYPEGRYAKTGYVKLGTIYTALGDMEKSKSALDRLSKRYPDSDEAKNAKPRLAKNLMEMGLKKEGAEIYSEMLRTDGAYTAWQFLAAGNALIESKSWDLANQAFEKARRLAGTNSTAVARARLGLAESAWRQGSLAEARESLDAFLADQKMAKMAIAADANFMLVAVASEQGRTEKDATMRTKYFNAAIGALKKVRQYWAKKPLWEQDTLDLMSGDVLVNRMKAEEAMGLKDEALETCASAAGRFQAFLQSRGVSETNPIDKMEKGALDNLERAYASIVPLFSKMGAEQADRVMRFGQEYLTYFPEGKARTVVENCMNQAKADLPAGAK